MYRLFSTPLTIPALSRKLTKALIHIVALGYLAGLFALGIADELGPDPVQTLLNETGTRAIQFLLLTLAVSPLAKHLPCGDLMKFRRMLGIYSFVFALAHFLTYVLFELQLDLGLIGSEIIKRPYITVGFVALTGLLSLTLTSPMAIRRRMGRHWQTLHNAVYLIMLLALLHFTWSQKTGWQEPVWYWIIALLLLLFRAVPAYTRLRRKRSV
ncbi:sulfite oxidase heme-binding subunit YedZ [Alteromonas sp. CYL-A6]|uniref:sulfite oxidase heme-binding subunit YedZ n=1 Tax=Alteromonas nitratireducens TaxID=3390813 RepID=UPI0034BE3A28